jgi:hypothetical protein
LHLCGSGRVAGSDRSLLGIEVEQVLLDKALLARGEVRSWLGIAGHALDLDHVHGDDVSSSGEVDDGASAGEVQDHPNVLPGQAQFTRDPVRMPSLAEQVFDGQDHVRTLGPGHLARAAVTGVTGVTVTGSRTNY